MERLKVSADSAFESIVAFDAALNDSTANWTIAVSAVALSESRELREPTLIYIALIALVTGCASTPSVPPLSPNDTVTLSRGNYKMIKAGARGVSGGFSILFIPFGSPTYADAKANLYASLGQKLEGRSIALINQTTDYGGLGLILVSFPNLTITADVIEFTDR